MKFQEAIERLENGQKVRRSSWFGEIFIEKNQQIPSVISATRIDADGKQIVYDAAFLLSDYVADDWEVYARH